MTPKPWAEREAEIREREPTTTFFGPMILVSPDERDALLAEIERLREALQPFAEEARYIPETFENVEPFNETATINNGDFRRAREALEGL